MRPFGFRVKVAFVWHPCQGAAVFIPLNRRFSLFLTRVRVAGREILDEFLGPSFDLVGRLKPESQLGQREVAPRIGVQANSRGSSAAKTPGFARKKNCTPKRGASSARRHSIVSIEARWSVMMNSFADASIRF